MKSANPNVVVMMGGAVGILDSQFTNFWDSVFNNLSTDNESKSFEMFNVHLYEDLYGIPERVQYFRNKLDSYPKFYEIPIIVTEYGGPQPKEFDSTDPWNGDYPITSSWHNDLVQEFQLDPCIMAGNLKSTVNHPNGYPNALRMFAYGLGPEDQWLEEKRDRIQGRDHVYRTLLGLSEGVKKFYWWNIQSSGMMGPGGCQFKHLTFGKMSIMEENGTLTPNPTFYYYQTMTGFLNNSKSATRISTENNTRYYLFEVTNINDSNLFVVWENRDRFYGENQSEISFTFYVPWQIAKVSGLFGGTEIVTAVNGNITINITDTPIFVEEA